jgi:hypothetical protein
VAVQEGERGRFGVFVEWQVSLSPGLLVWSSQHRQSAAEAFTAEAVEELALVGFVAAVDDEVVLLERVCWRRTPFRTRKWVVHGHW